MKKIGFIDYYLDEWHANNYPEFIKKAVGDKLAVSYAYAEIDSPKGGLTTDEWCDKYGVERLNSIEEIVEKSDCIIVLSPDNPERHFDLCQLPLASGKRTYVDKTFAPTKKIAQDLVDLAKKSNTPFFSSSALRFADEMKDIAKGDVSFINSRGPGVFEIYAIHQLEPIVMMMGSDAKRVMSVGTKEAPALLIEFGGGRRALLSLFDSWDVNFAMNIAYADGSFGAISAMNNYFDNFIAEMCDFFLTGDVKVAPEETVAIMAIIESGALALEKPLEWIEL